MRQQENITLTKLERIYHNRRSQTLSQNYERSYANTKTIEEVDRLSSYKERDYVITTIAKLLFDLLYNLSNIELTILRIYLNDILAKD